jgi:hypothetical protein
VDDVEAAGVNASLDLASGEAEGDKLTAFHNALLPIREHRDQSLTWTTLSTYTVVNVVQVAPRSRPYRHAPAIPPPA